MTKTTPSPVAGLEPQAVWQFFAGIAATPRPSKKEQQIRAHLREVVRGLKLACREDHVGNLIIDVPASPGCERAPITVLQAHMDMVCEKNTGVDHDFDRDPIRLVLDRDAAGQATVRADGTTLGADNGLGIALALAAATSPEVVHGPLEIVLTVDEEAGMTGANAISPETFRGRRLLNLDSEEDDVFYIGCAGGCESDLSWEFPTEPAPNLEAVRVSVRGLRGGHSGGDIHENRGNANKLLVRTLLGVLGDIRIASIQGGSKRNAIPREATAELCGPRGILAALTKLAARVTAETRSESGETGAAITAEPCAAGRVASAADSRRLLCALAAIPYGVLGMHRKAAGLVETSNNLSIIESTAAANHLRIVVGTLSRSSCESRLDETLSQIHAIGDLAGAAASTANRYPAWEPDPDAPLVARCCRVFEKTFGKKPRIAAIHAGLECGIIGRRVGDIQMISFGPHIAGAHSPDERVWVDSVARNWRLLTAVLADLAQG